MRIRLAQTAVVAWTVGWFAYFVYSLTGWGQR